jgi:ribosomal protein L11 methyltransferase
MSMEWVELSLPAGALADEIAALIASVDEVASEGVHVRGEEIVLWAPAAEAEAAAEGLRAAARRLAEAGFEVDPAAVRIRPAPPEDEWRDAWKRYFRVTRVSRRIVIVPSWEKDGFTAEADDVVLDLDPGRAFGTGAHASTRLCLRELETLRDEDGLDAPRWLDVGCGSGILSIAAAKLWPGSRGVAVDVDPIAVGATVENAERNGVADRIAASEDPIERVEGSYELVVANIQADVLETMKEALFARVADGGALVLSGLLAHQAGPIGAIYTKLGLTSWRVSTLDDDRDWSAIVLRR